MAKLEIKANVGLPTRKGVIRQTINDLKKVKNESAKQVARAFFTFMQTEMVPVDTGALCDSGKLLEEDEAHYSIQYDASFGERKARGGSIPDNVNLEDSYAVFVNENTAFLSEGLGTWNAYKTKIKVRVGETQQIYKINKSVFYGEGRQLQARQRNFGTRLIYKKDKLVRLREKENRAKDKRSKELKQKISVVKRATRSLKSFYRKSTMELEGELIEAQMFGISKKELDYYQGKTKEEFEQAKDNHDNVYNAIRWFAKHDDEINERTKKAFYTAVAEYQNKISRNISYKKFHNNNELSPIQKKRAKKGQQIIEESKKIISTANKNMSKVPAGAFFGADIFTPQGTVTEEYRQFMQTSVRRGQNYVSKFDDINQKLKDNQSILEFVARIQDSYYTNGSLQNLSEADLFMLAKSSYQDKDNHYRRVRLSNYTDLMRDEKASLLAHKSATKILLESNKKSTKQYAERYKLLAELNKALDKFGNASMSSKKAIRANDLIGVFGKPFYEKEIKPLVSGNLSTKKQKQDFLIKTKLKLVDEQEKAKVSKAKALKRYQINKEKKAKLDEEIDNITTKWRNIAIEEMRGLPLDKLEALYDNQIHYRETLIKAVEDAPMRYYNHQEVELKKAQKRLAYGKRLKENNSEKGKKKKLQLKLNERNLKRKEGIMENVARKVAKLK